jgi:myo-inositol 2-dehydrogenase / D-chiro-inositol 1-dehydrogenase
MARLGVIGCGRIGRVHADSIDVHPHAELAVVCDPIDDAAREVASRYGAGWGTDVDAVIGDPAIDAVVVASPTPTHVDLLTRAVRAGKAVLCEKPIDLDLARGRCLPNRDRHARRSGDGGLQPTLRPVLPRHPDACRRG